LRKIYSDICKKLVIAPVGVGDGKILCCEEEAKEL
jgi:hypothetical protein